MLAYVFWHWPSSTVAVRDYERYQRDFHEALGAAPPIGFRRSFTHTVRDAPWANDGGPAYEDWYLIDDSAALDPLNAAAVTASRAQPHDVAARHAAGGTAGLYRLRVGVSVAALDAPRVATWFSKPAGMGYPELFAALDPVCERSGAGVWLRQMTLGPATECCLLGAGNDALPAALRGREIPLRTIWPA